MTDSLGTPNGGVPRHLFELDDLPDEQALDAAVRDVPASVKRAPRHHDREVRSPSARPARNGSRGEGPVLLLSVEDAARSLSIGRSKAYELIAEGALESVHIGRSTRVPVAALHDLLDRLRDAADGQAGTRP